MTKFKITFVVTNEEDDPDPSSVLDGAIMAMDDVVAHIEATGCGDFEADENDVCVGEVSDD